MLCRSKQWYCFEYHPNSGSFLSAEQTHSEILGSENTPENSMQKVRVHYENNAPFLVAERVEREIEVSHWGNVAVTDKIWLKHNGASLTGPFSRFDYQERVRI